MKKHTIRFASAVALVALCAVLAQGGGWSIITLKEFPDSAVAGKPLVLTFTVRQHGNHPVSDLKPMIRATAGKQEVTVAARPTKNAGEYTASLLMANPGEWTISIDGGFNAEDKTRAYNSMVLPPLSVGRAEALTKLSHEAQGSRLFVAKGCVGCHAAGSDKDVTTKQFAKDYLRMFLADPSIRRVEMPNLGLSENEITALTAYLTRPVKGN
jgi:hypothetical protein